MKSKIIETSPFWFPLIISLIFFFLLLSENISRSLSFALCVLSYILCYLATEWVVIKEQVITKANSLDEINKRLESISRIVSMLDQFSDIDVLMNAVINAVESDMKFDKAVKSEQSKEFHLYLSEIKYNDFFKRFFVFSDADKRISRIPKFYFESFIWKKLIEDTNCYHSLQIINTGTKDFYVNDRHRLDRELNILERQIQQGRLTCFEKL